MKKSLIFLLFFILISFSDGFSQSGIGVVTWNLQHFGHTKTEKMMAFIAETLQPYEVIAIQEVVGKYGGVKAVARLKRALNKGADGPWEADVSPITTGNPYQSERYAFFWNTEKIKQVKKGWLHQDHEQEITREPFLASFAVKKDTFTLVSFHAVPKKRNPEQEIKYLKYFPKRYFHYPLLFLGDFNTPQSNNVFNPLKSMGYRPALIGQKTTLRMKCIHGDCLASEYDNIFYSTKEIRKESAGIIPFYQSFPDMVAARKYSDHVPVVLFFNVLSK